VNLFVGVGSSINEEGRPAKAVKETTDGTDTWTITCDDGSYSKTLPVVLTDESAEAMSDLFAPDGGDSFWAWRIGTRETDADAAEPTPSPGAAGAQHAAAPADAPGAPAAVSPHMEGVTKGCPGPRGGVLRPLFAVLLCVATKNTQIYVNVLVFAHNRPQRPLTPRTPPPR